MKTSVIGFPRVGTLRELKFASEKYFRKEITQDELLQVAKELRKTHWKMQKNAGIDYISSNDFSFYDMTLDTAVLLGIVPERYRKLGLSPLDTYFAMARGYQGESGDVKALAMKKWFNTNYHYIVPEVEDDMDADVITFEASRSDLQILDALRENHFETEVGPGVYDIHSPRVPSVEEIVKALQIMLTKIERDKLWVNPDCGLKTRGIPETEASLRHMVEAAKLVRNK